MPYLLLLLAAAALGRLGGSRRLLLLRSLCTHKHRSQLITPSKVGEHTRQRRMHAKEEYGQRTYHNADERGAWGRRERETETERGMYYYYRGEGRAGRSEGELKGEPSFLRAVALTDEDTSLSLSLTPHRLFHAGRCTQHTVGRTNGRTDGLMNRLTKIF